jgi:hypothetical protein
MPFRSSGPLTRSAPPQAYPKTPQTPPELVGKGLHILTPMYGGQCTVNYVRSLMQLVLKCHSFNLPFAFSFIHNESLVSRARNRLVDIFMKESVLSHSVFIDADIGFNPDDLFHMMTTDFPIIGAGCVKKSINWPRIQMALKRSPERQFTHQEMASLGGEFVINWEPFAGQKTFNLKEPIKVKQLGTGLLMITRPVYQKFRESFPDRWYESPEDPAALPGPIHDYFQVKINSQSRKYESEDYWFCNDATSLGFDIMLLPWMVTSHMGTYEFSGDLPAVAALAGQM